MKNKDVILELSRIRNGYMDPQSAHAKKVMAAAIRKLIKYNNAVTELKLVELT